MRPSVRVSNTHIKKKRFQPKVLYISLIGTLLEASASRIQLVFVNELVEDNGKVDNAYHVSMLSFS